MKITGLALASAAALALTACGGGTSNSSTTSSNTLSADPLANVGSDFGNVTDLDAGNSGFGTVNSSGAAPDDSLANASTGNSAAGNTSAGASANTLGNSN